MRGTGEIRLMGHGRTERMRWAVPLAALAAAGLLAHARAQQEPEVRPAMSLILATDAQPGGPAYDYRIGVHEITNEQYAAFLSDAYADALLAPAHSAASEFLHFDTTTGAVYLHNAAEPTVGAGAAEHTILMFSPAVGVGIRFADDVYAAVADEGGVDYSEHPVVGVSWYGAVKFCNWLTMHHGILPSDRAYTEGPTPADWHPVTIDAASWQVRDLADDERNAFVSEVRGYRLPMDDGANNVGSIDAADQFNEWYKAAAWDDAAEANRLYGFGRATIGQPDANYLSSGDPFTTSGTTPVGWYDGVHTLTGGAVTRNTANAYGLYDMCGNAAEWVQDHGTLATRRSVRGGHWQNSASSTLLDNLHRDGELATAVRAYIGFRVAQATAPLGAMSVDATCAADPTCPIAFVGYVGGPYEPDDLAFAITAFPDAPAEIEVCAEDSWLRIVDEEDCAEAFLPPGDELAVEFALATAAADALSAVRPGPVDLQVVSPADGQPDGPFYGFRMARIETTNAQYVQFLNDALTNLANARGAYLYVDASTGVVYLHQAATGTIAADAGDRTIKLFDPAVAGRITYDTATSRYTVQAGYETHPVAGVSWFGAAKYCNWLTLHSGLVTTDRAYTEGPHAGDWRPVVISAASWWGTDDTTTTTSPTGDARDLTAAERLALVQTVKGFRLPMDHGEHGASTYSEWYKAAAWNGATNDDYAFGSSTLSPGAANVNDNADPFTPGTTPAAFFDGTLYNPGGNGPIGDGSEFQTAAESNRYELYDLTGNVAEWMQDAGEDTAHHAIRGGSHVNEIGSPLLRNDGRTTIAAGDVRADVGFRVVQAAIDHVGSATFQNLATGSATARDVRLLVIEPVSLSPRTPLTLSGYYGGPFAGSGAVYTLNSRSASPMNWQATRGTTWLDLNGDSVASGVLAPNGAAMVTVTTNAAAATRPPGEHAMTLTFRNQTTGYAETVQAALTVLEPLANDCTWGAASCPADVLELLPSPVWNPGISGASPSFEWTYDLANFASIPIGFSVTCPATWIGFAVGEASGTLAAAGDAGGMDERTTHAMTTPAFENLAVGTHTATVTIRNTTANTLSTRTVRVTVLDPLAIAEPGSADWSGPIGGPFTPDAESVTTFTLSNLAGYVVDYAVSANVPWIRIAGETTYATVLPPMDGESVVISLGEEAAALPAGEHTGLINFTDLASGHVQTRTVRIAIGAGVSLAPETNLDIACRIGGACSPSATLYSITNPADAQDDIAWWFELAAAEPADADWLSIAGLPIDEAGGTIAPGTSATIVVSVEPPLEAGLYQATLRLRHDGAIQGPAIERTVTLIAVEPLLADPADSLVPASAVQPSGPTYDFRIGRYDVTNAQFVAFLNDVIARPAEPRGAFVYLDELTGDLYINTAEDGQRGEGPDGRTTKLFAPGVAGRITYSAITDTYTVVGGYADHPVVGVSWYGAAKFCNWLTLDQGLATSQRCYAEAAAPDLSGWRPATITSGAWNTRDLNPAERVLLVNSYRGYRLPMDQGSNNANPAVDTADAYNEWYKAAAWKGSSNTLYGFGRNTIAPADANYAGAGHPVPPGTTPVGFYRAGNLLTSGTPTADTANAYGLYDMSGNVFQWMQDRQGAAGGDRALRGGSWSWPQGANGTQTTRRVAAGPASTLADTGLRVVRTVPPPNPSDASGDGSVDLADHFRFGMCLDGPAVLVEPACLSSDFDGDGDVDLADAAILQRYLP
jgi:formylglycine-generating enzyme required for sulfatase activity